MASDVEAKDTSLQVQKKEESSVVYTLEIEVDSDRVSKAFDRAFHDLKKRARIKGFRPGKAPRSVLEKVYGDSVAEEIEHALVSETLPEAVHQAELQPIVEPAIHAHPPTNGEAFSYSVRIEVKPEIEIGELEGIKGTRPPMDVTDDDVDKELEELRQRNAPFVEASEETQLEQGHFTKIDFEGKIDGELFEGGSAEDQVLEIGSGRMIPGFEDQLVGAKAGDEVEVNVTFPEDYQSEDHAGKDAVFMVKIHEIKVREVAELDDEFAKDLGEFESLEELRAKIKEDLGTNRERESKAGLRKTLLDSVLEIVDFEVPPGLVDAQLKHRIEQMFQQFGGQLPQEFMQQQMETYQEQWRPMVEREVREMFLLEALGRSLELEATEEEIEAKINEMAAQQGMAPEQLQKIYAEGNLTAAIRGQVLEEKAIESLIERAEITDGPIEEEAEES